MAEFSSRPKIPKGWPPGIKNTWDFLIDNSYGGYTFNWSDENQRPEKGYTIWSPFRQDTEYIQPSSKDFMFNFIVDDLEALLDILRSEGIDQVGEMEDTEFGKFGWILDPEGNKIELWEPAEE